MLFNTFKTKIAQTHVFPKKKKMKSLYTKCKRRDNILNISECLNEKDYSKYYLNEKE